MERDLQVKTVEALLFLSEEPLRIEQIAGILSIPKDEAVQIVEELQQQLASGRRGLQVMETAGGYQMGTLPELAPILDRAFSEEVSSNLSTASLEVLAIIAYKQPVTRIEIESIRGVRCERVLDNLLKRKLIRISGRRDSPGRPLLYCTTADFLKYFGLKELADLPPLDEGYDEGESPGETPAAL